MRVLVMRPQAESEALAARLTACGHEPVVAPVVAILPLPVTLPPRRIDAVIATSPQATATLDPAVRDRLKTLPTYVVGQASAAAVRSQGFADVRIGAGDGAALLDLVRLTSARGAHLVHLAGRVRKFDLADALMAEGYALTVVDTYDAAAVPRWAETVPQAQTGPAFEACLHFSQRSAALAVAGSRGSRIAAAFDAARHVCLSDDVASPLRTIALRHVKVAAAPTAASLLQAFDARMHPRP